MAFDTYTSPPTRLTAGDTYNWTDIPEDIDDVTAYVVRFRSITDSNIEFSVTGTDNGTNFSFSLAGSTTASLDGDEFTIVKLITESGGRKTIQAGKLTLLDNPDNDPTKSFNRRMVDLLEAHIEGRIPQGLESHTVGGVPINKISFADAQALLDNYRARLDYEKKQKLAAENPGRGTGSTVKIHF